MILQLAINGLLAAAVVALIAVGFALINNATRFLHFAHGIVFTAGAYSAFLVLRTLHPEFPIPLPLAIVIPMMLGALIDIVVYRPLRRRRSGPLILLLASFGTYVVLQNLISLSFGDSTQTIRIGPVTEGFSIAGARITPIQTALVLTSIALLIAVWFFLRTTKLGRAIRAVANDPDLAKLSGINSDRVILWVFAIGSALAGIAGILVALDVDMTPTMGMRALMMGVVAVIIGGVDSIPGIALGALLLAMAQQFGAWYFSSQWQDAIAFAILLVFLIFRPQGFFGKKIKKATV